jgi:AcrR family transcriptional regulator
MVADLGVSKTRKRGPYAPEATRAELMNVALQSFSERGYHATTVQTIVQRANLTKGAFYHHFENKEDLLRQIHAEYASELLSSARQVSSVDAEPIDQLRMLIRNAVILFARYRQHVAVFYQENRFLSGKPYAAIRKMHDDEEAVLRDILNRAKDAGQLRSDIDTRLIVFAISGMTAWIYQWYQPNGPIHIDDIADGLADIVLNGTATGNAKIIAPAAAKRPAGAAAKATPKTPARRAATPAIAVRSAAKPAARRATKTAAKPAKRTARAG